MWREVSGEFALGRHEAGLLLECARTLDDLDALAQVIAREGVAVDGKPHPCLVESRQLRLTLARLIASLRLPEDPDELAGRPQRRGAARGTYAR